MPQPCARRAHRQPPTEKHSKVVGRIYPIQLYTPQMNNTPQLLAEHIQYKYMSQNICVFVFAGVTPLNIIFDIPLPSYYPKYSMWVCYLSFGGLYFCICVFVFVGNGFGCTL